MSSHETTDDQREINHEECQEFVGAIENLKEFWEWGDGYNPSIYEDLYGPESEWPQDIKQDFADRTSVQHSEFNISDISVSIHKQILSTRDLEEENKFAFTREVPATKIEWVAMKVEKYKTGGNTVREFSQYTVGRNTGDPYVTDFQGWRSIQQPNGEFIEEQGDMSHGVLAAHEKLHAAQTVADSNGEALEDSLEYIRAFEELEEVIAEEKRQRAELEKITGIYTRRFTIARFNEIMHYLGQAGSENHISYGP